jgi:hypothetical protein
MARFVPGEMGRRDMMIIEAIYASAAQGGKRVEVACAQDLGPCDLIQGGCVAAHSTMRSLLTTYKGPLFQLTDDRSNTQDVGQTNQVAHTADAAAFCARKFACYISRIYDQSGNGNDLSQSTVKSMPPYIVWRPHNLPAAWSTSRTYLRQEVTRNLWPFLLRW